MNKDYPPEVQELIDSVLHYIDTHGTHDHISMEMAHLRKRAEPFRPKPARTTTVHWSDDGGRCYAYEAIELTPEVRVALDVAGIEVNE